MTMQVSVTGHHIEVTDPLRTHVMDKMKKVEKKFPHITNVHVTLTLDNQYEHKAEANMHVAGGKSGKIFATSKSEDMYTSINDLMKKLETQLISHKDLLQGHDHDEHQ